MAIRAEPLTSLCIAIAVAGQLLASGSVAAASGAEAGQPETLRVAVYPYLSFAPLYIAEAEGFFGEQDLSVRLVEFRNSGDSLPVLLGGDIDVGSIFTIGLLNAVVRGEKVRVVANKGELAAEGCPADGFMVRAGLVSQMENPDRALLASLTYGVDPTWLDSYFLDRALSRWDLRLEDVSTRLVGNPATRMEALANGSLDVAFFSEPWITRLENNGGGSMWLPAADVAPGYPLGVITFGEPLLSDGGDGSAGVRFIRAYLKAIAQLNEGRTPRNIEILSQATQLDPELLAGVCWPSYDRGGRINARAVSQYSRWAAERGLTDEAVQPDEFWDPRFVESAAE